MEQYRVKVNLLNKRTKPEENTLDKSTVSGQVKKNDYLDLSWAAKLNNGDWYTDGKGGYYWGGGVEESPSEIIIQKKDKSLPFQEQIMANYNINTLELTKDINLNDLLVFDYKLKSTKGENTIIGILDFPINKNADSLTNAFTNQDAFSIKPVNDHGTYMAGLIGGRKGLIGISPSCGILELPFYDEWAIPSEDDIIRRLEFVASLDKTVILNVSQSLPESFGNAISAINKLSDNTIVVSAAGTDDELFKDKIQIPSNLNNVVAVGSISNNYKFPRNKSMNPKIDFILPDYQYVLPIRKGTNKYNLAMGDSCATAIISGVISLILSYKKKQISIDELKDTIKKNSQKLNENINYTELIIIKP